MHRFAATLLVLSLSATAVMGEKCTKAEKLTQNMAHSHCMSAVQARINAGTQMSEICDRLEEQIEVCGAHKAQCLRTEELRLFKDLQLESLIKMTDGQEIGRIYRECKVIKEYLNSGRKPWKATDRCTKKQVGKAMDNRQRCISEAKADLTLGQGFAGRARPLGSNVICDFFQRSLYECAEELRHCYSPEEYEKLLDQSPQALNKLLDAMQSRFDLTTCNIGRVFSQRRRSGAAKSTSLSLSVMIPAFLAVVLGGRNFC